MIFYVKCEWRAKGNNSTKVDGYKSNNRFCKKLLWYRNENYKGALLQTSYYFCKRSYKALSLFDLKLLKTLVLTSVREIKTYKSW